MSGGLPNCSTHKTTCSPICMRSPTCRVAVSRPSVVRFSAKHPGTACIPASRLSCSTHSSGWPRVAVSYQAPAGAQFAPAHVLFWLGPLLTAADGLDHCFVHSRIFLHQPRLCSQIPQSCRHSPQVEHDGVSHRSSLPQQVCPAGRRSAILSTFGREKSLSASTLSQSGQRGALASERTRTSTLLPHSVQRYS
jgi:hypothetical protein